VNLRAVFHLVGYLLMVLALAILGCWGVSLLYPDPADARYGLLESAALVLLSGGLIAYCTRGRIDLSRRDGFGIVAFGWLAASIFGSLPYLLSGTVPDPASGIFETMSGFTTTGASVLTDLEALPRGILFWRALTQWLGGMGVLVLCVAILPFLGVGGMQIYRAEMPGPSKDRLTPRIATTAKLLWGVYLLLTACQAVLLRLGGMDWFDSLCHTFATMSTGGFSTRTASVAAFNSLYIESVIVVFMLLAGINFGLHYRALRGRPLVYFRDPEFRFFLGFWALVCLGVAVHLRVSSYDSFAFALRSALFTCTSILTTTGFGTEDFDLWPSAARVTLVLLMFVGGCAGSTAGGIKIVRVFIVLKKTLREVRLFTQPNAVVQVKLGRKPVGTDIVSNISAFFIMFALIFGAATIVMGFFTPDIDTAAPTVAATLGHIGPGLGAVGPSHNYAFIPGAGKLVLVFLMLLGRLELYTVLAILLPSFWRR